MCKCLLPGGLKLFSFQFSVCSFCSSPLEGTSTVSNVIPCKGDTRKTSQDAHLRVASDHIVQILSPSPNSPKCSSPAILGTGLAQCRTHGGQRLEEALGGESYACGWTGTGICRSSVNSSLNKDPANMAPFMLLPSMLDKTYRAWKKRSNI